MKVHFTGSCYWQKITHLLIFRKLNFLNLLNVFLYEIWVQWKKYFRAETPLSSQVTRADDLSQLSSSSHDRCIACHHAVMVHHHTVCSRELSTSWSLIGTVCSGMKVRHAESSPVKAGQETCFQWQQQSLMSEPMTADSDPGSVLQTLLCFATSESERESHFLSYSAPSNAF